MTTAETFAYFGAAGEDELLLETLGDPEMDPALAECVLDRLDNGTDTDREALVADYLASGDAMDLQSRWRAWIGG